MVFVSGFNLDLSGRVGQIGFHRYGVQTVRIPERPDCVGTIFWWEKNLLKFF